jgi:hypothetical protein
MTNANTNVTFNIYLCSKLCRAVFAERRKNNGQASECYALPPGYYTYRLHPKGSAVVHNEPMVGWMAGWQMQERNNGSDARAGCKWM